MIERDIPSELLEAVQMKEHKHSVSEEDTDHSKRKKK
jgi:hypothetical protein